MKEEILRGIIVCLYYLYHVPFYYFRNFTVEPSIWLENLWKGERLWLDDDIWSRIQQGEEWMMTFDKVIVESELYIVNRESDQFQGWGEGGRGMSTLYMDLKKLSVTK